jgi:hypothetical protein
MGYILQFGSPEDVSRKLVTETTACEAYAPHALSSVGTTPGRSRACRHHDLSKILEVRCGDRKEQFGAFWWIGAENGSSSDGSE